MAGATVQYNPDAMLTWIATDGTTGQELLPMPKGVAGITFCDAIGRKVVIDAAIDEARWLNLFKMRMGSGIKVSYRITRLRIQSLYVYLLALLDDFHAIPCQGPDHANCHNAQGSECVVVDKLCETEICAVEACMLAQSTAGSA